MSRSARPARLRRLRTLSGLVLAVLGTLLWAGVFAVPFLPLSLSRAGLLATGLFLAGEAGFWLGAVIAGPDVARWVLRMVPWRRRRLESAARRVEGDVGL